MKILFFLYLILNIIQASDDGFINEINNLARQEDRAIKRKIRKLVKKKKNPKKKKIKLIIRILKSVTGEIKSPKSKKGKNFSKLEKKIRSKPRLLKKFVKMVRIYKKIDKKKKRKLLQRVYNALNHVVDSTAGVLDYLIKHFTSGDTIINTYLKPLSTFYALHSIKKHYDDKENFRLQQSHFKNLMETNKTISELLHGDLNDLQTSLLQMDRVYNKIESLNHSFNFRMDSKIEVLRNTHMGLS